MLLESMQQITGEQAMTENKPTDDKTRIAPRNRVNETVNEDEKTVVKTLDDRTRISPQNHQRNKAGRTINSTANNTMPTSHNNDAKTRVAPPKTTPKSSIDESRTTSQESPQLLTPADIDKTERIINNRFVLKESLGVGGMAMVFRALDLRKQETGDSDPYIAIKILSSEFEEHPQAFVSLQREAKKSQILSHPNVIKVYDFDREGDLVYLTMEELRGRPLKKLIREYSQGMPLTMAIPIIQAISDGLAYAHKKNIVHADLKPDNIFYTDDGEVKIIDFGIARIMTDLDAKGDSSGHYDPDEVVGLTPSYASLEMLNDEAPLPSDDIYALGLISYELLTGQHPFNNEQADIANKNSMSFKKVSQLKGYQWKAIASALSFEHKDRLKSGQEFRDLFSGKGKTVKRLAAGLIAVSLIFIGSLFIPQDNNLDHLYDELKPSEQVRFDKLIKEGNTLLGFDDWNNALAMFEQAHGILPQHSITNASLDKAVLKIIDSFENNSSNLDPQLALKQINQLLKYKSLADNERLINYKTKIESQ